MKTYITKIKEIENDLFLEIPEEVIQQLGLKEDDEMTITLFDDRIVVRKTADIQLFECQLCYHPADIHYKSEDMEFWNESDEYITFRCEKEQLSGKEAAYNLAKERADEYARQLGIQLKFNTTVKDGNLTYCSNTYLSKKPQSVD